MSLGTIGKKLCGWATSSHIDPSNGSFPYAFTMACAASLAASNASAQADAPPHEYLDLGPHFVISPGLGSTTEYRDILLRSAASARLGATTTYRGFSLSGTYDHSTTSPETFAYEVGASYSHVLPFFDVHAGIVNSRIEGNFSDRCTSARFGASTNRLSFVYGDISAEGSPDGVCHAVSLAAAHDAWSSRQYQLTFRFSATKWKTDSLTAHGWSLRAIGRWQLNKNQSIHYHAGYIASRLEKDALKSEPSGTAFGLNYVWEFR